MLTNTPFENDPIDDQDQDMEEIPSWNWKTHLAHQRLRTRFVFWHRYSGRIIVLIVLFIIYLFILGKWVFQMQIGDGLQTIFDAFSLVEVVSP